MTNLPRWRCHKEVNALKISDVTEASFGGRFLHGDGAVMLVSSEYVRKHNPQIGGYYVLYDDGYQSFSPALAFEAGYTRIQDGQ